MTEFVAQHGNELIKQSKSVTAMNGVNMRQAVRIAWANPVYPLPSPLCLMEGVDNGTWHSTRHLPLGTEHGTWHRTRHLAQLAQNTALDTATAHFISTVYRQRVTELSLRGVRGWA
jgi:hypothetical protein